MTPGEGLNRLLCFIDSITEPEMPTDELHLIEEIKKAENDDYRLYLIEALCRLRYARSRWT